MGKGVVIPFGSDLSAYMPKSGGQFTGEVKASVNTAYTTYKLRNCAILPSAPSSMKNGEIAFVYT
jgi:hypothetical protein